MPTNTGCVEHCGFEEKLILGLEDERWDQLSSQDIGSIASMNLVTLVTGDTALLRADRQG